jgi:hypothetical protein
LTSRPEVLPAAAKTATANEAAHFIYNHIICRYEIPPNQFNPTTGLNLQMSDQKSGRNSQDPTSLFDTISHNTIGIRALSASIPFGQQPLLDKETTVQNSKRSIEGVPFSLCSFKVLRMLGLHSSASHIQNNWFSLEVYIGT